MVAYSSSDGRDAWLVAPGGRDGAALRARGRPEWNSGVKDPSIYRLPKAEMLRRKALLASQHNAFHPQRKKVGAQDGMVGSWQGQQFLLVEDKEVLPLEAPYSGEASGQHCRPFPCRHCTRIGPPHPRRINAHLITISYASQRTSHRQFLSSPLVPPLSRTHSPTPQACGARHPNFDHIPSHLKLGISDTSPRLACAGPHPRIPTQVTTPNPTPTPNRTPIPTP